MEESYTTLRQIKLRWDLPHFLQYSYILNRIVQHLSSYIIVLNERLHIAINVQMYADALTDDARAQTKQPISLAPYVNRHRLPFSSFYSHQLLRISAKLQLRYDTLSLLN